MYEHVQKWACAHQQRCIYSFFFLLKWDKHSGLKSSQSTEITQLTVTEALHSARAKSLSSVLISSFLHRYIPAQTLRSQNAGLLIVPRVSKCTVGGRAFSYWAPLLWNDLPIEIRGADSLSIFKSRLKSYLYSNILEKAVTKLNNLLLSSDKGFISLLVLLDLSAAFDTINHLILIDRLETLVSLSANESSYRSMS